MGRISLATGQYYHVYNRGVLRQPIFIVEDDYLRFLTGLQDFNASKVQPREVGPREALVSILSWCLIPNHFHLFLRQARDGGTGLFMQRLETGFTMYMNKKYDRSGHLFQSKYQAKLIDNDAHFLHISRYIHLNPLDLIEPDWEERGVKNSQRAMRFIEEYRWSSYRNWVGEKHFPSIIDEKIVREISQIAGNYRSFVRGWTSRGSTS